MFGTLEKIKENKDIKSGGFSLGNLYLHRPSVTNLEEDAAQTQKRLRTKLSLHEELNSLHMYDSVLLGKTQVKQVRKSKRPLEDQFWAEGEKPKDASPTKKKKRQSQSKSPRKSLTR